MKNSAALILLFLTSIQWINALPDYPRIEDLGFRDPLFRQLGDLVSDYHQSTAKGEPLPGLIFFRYSLKEETDLFALSSRCGLPYETVATLNGYTKNRPIPEKTEILIPSVPGIFTPASPRNDLDRFIAAAPRGEGLTCHPFGGTEYRFYPGERFNGVERAFFLGVFLGFPLRSGVVSSPYGVRDDPFTGHSSFHHGVDLAAPLGSEVLAARRGRVIFSGKDEVYGNYLIISHENGYRTLYGHLKNKLVRLNQEVVLGMIIGEVGITGQTTGPHLHFEVIKDGITKDPSDYIH